MTTTNIPIARTRFTEEMRKRWEERRAERERLARVFNPDHRRGDGLNIEAIGILIGWAEQDENYIRQFPLQGSWGQGSWGVIEMDADLVADPDESAEDVSDKRLLTASEKARLNGACQTSYCMAGQTVVQSGYALDFNGAYTGGDYSTVAASAEQCFREEWTGEFDEQGWPIMAKTSKRYDISTKAAQILGLNDREEVSFFGGGNTIRDLKQWANTFCERRGLDHLYPGEGLHRNAEYVLDC